MTNGSGKTFGHGWDVRLSVVFVFFCCSQHTDLCPGEEEASLIIYEGPSLINGRPIVVIATRDSNPKTGEMLYTWILDAEIPPEIAAFYQDTDESICGGCKFRAQPKLDAGDMRPASTRMCYVRLSSLSDEFGTPKADEFMGPAEVWQAWKDGKFGVWTRPWFDDVERRVVWYQYGGPLSIRIGSYGDPGAVPTVVWADLVRYAKNFTGYTHLWRPKNCDGCGSRWTSEYSEFYGGTDYRCTQCGGHYKSQCDPALKEICMASVDTPEERKAANQLGWRGFVVAPTDVDVSLLEDDVLCPMTAGKPVTCNTCHMCQGTSSKVKQNIYEKVHGVNLANHVW